MRLLSAILLFFLFSISVNGQNDTPEISKHVINVKDKQYHACRWDFLCNSRNMFEQFQVYIAKKSINDDGYLLVRTGTFQGEYVGKNLYIYLENGKVITCIDKGIRNRVDEESIVLYNLTSEEIKQLCNSDIHKIIFGLCSGSGQFFRKEQYSAVNEIKSYTTIYDYNNPNYNPPTKYSTSKELSFLFFIF